MGFVSRQYDDFVWEYKYRPARVADIVLPDRFKRQFQAMVESRRLSNMLLSGPRGCGKTTVCFALADETGLDAIYVNMSKDRSIDVIRDRLTRFASTVSSDDCKKLLIGDEFDRLTPEAIDSLKGEMDRFGNNCVFLFTSNNKYKFAAHPVMSRLQEVDFQFTREETVQMKKQFYSVVMGILEKEGVAYEKKAVGRIVNEMFPDMRKTLTELQKLSQQFDAINSEAAETMLSLADMTLLYAALRDKDFNYVRERVADASVDPTQVYSTLFRTIEPHITEESLPAAMTIIDEYQFRSAFGADKQIPLTACCVRLMSECDWR